MILKNNKGIERDFELLFEIDKDNNKFVIYKDILSNTLYVGKKDDEKLKPLSEEEYIYINNIVEKINS